MGDRSQRHGVFERRFRESERAARGLKRVPFAVFLLLPLFFPTSLRADPLFYWTVDLAVGHDDQILADPYQLGIVSPVSDGFASGSSRFLLRWADLRADHRLDLLAHLGGVTYGEKVQGGDTEVGLSAVYRRRLLAPLALDVAATGSWFRRDEQAGGAPVFDQDLYSIDSRLGWALGRNWVVTGGGRYDWAKYPGREFTIDFQDEEQEQASVSLAASRRLGGRNRLSLEALYHRLTSNVPTSEYDGPTILLRASLVLPFRLGVTPVVAYGQRSFDSYLTADSSATRWDHSWQYGLTVVRPLSSRFNAFVEGTFLHQVSNIEDFEFDEARISAGISIQLAASRVSPVRLDPASPRRLTPVATPIGMRFRYVAPEAKSVSVVGDWNGWKAGRDVLHGPARGGLWEATIPLSPGIWRYAFVVDGVWKEPPEAPRTESDGFGGVRGVLEVSGP
jgi:AMP-activated protein kinase-like protein